MTYSIAANARDQEVRTFQLIKIDFVQLNGTPAPVYWTNAGFPIVTPSPSRSDQAPAARWIPMPFKAGSIGSRGESQNAASFLVGNADNSLSPIVYQVGYKPSAGDLVHVWEAWFDPSTTKAVPDDSTKLIIAAIQSMDVSRQNVEAWIRIVLCPPVIFQSKVMPPRSITSKCTLVFKGPACQYTGGDTTCVHTLVDCTAKGNLANFGGFPTLPAIQTPGM